jgi:hypothetical protein
MNSPNSLKLIRRIEDSDVINFIQNIRTAFVASYFFDSFWSKVASCIYEHDCFPRTNFPRAIDTSGKAKLGFSRSAFSVKICHETRSDTSCKQTI